MRRCRRCGKAEGDTEFTATQTTLCRPCTREYNKAYHAANKAKIHERQAAHRAAHPEKVKAAQNRWRGKRGEYARAYRLSAYGLTTEQYDALLIAQSGGCAICKESAPGKHPLHVDHDHACCPQGGGCCGKCVRGLLCTNCNRGLGAFRDREALLFEAADYLRRAKA